MKLFIDTEHEEVVELSDYANEALVDLIDCGVFSSEDCIRYGAYDMDIEDLLSTYEEYHYDIDIEDLANRFNNRDLIDYIVNSYSESDILECLDSDMVVDYVVQHYDYEDILCGINSQYLVDYVVENGFMKEQRTPIEQQTTNNLLKQLQEITTELSKRHSVVEQKTETRFEVED